jgi:hypothetical protein
MSKKEEFSEIIGEKKYEITTKPDTQPKEENEHKIHVIPTGTEELDNTENKVL